MRSVRHYRARADETLGTVSALLRGERKVARRSGMSQSAELGAIELLTRERDDAAASSSPRPRQKKTIELELTPDSESNFYLGLTHDPSDAGLFIATHVTHPVGAE